MNINYYTPFIKAKRNLRKAFAEFEAGLVSWREIEVAYNAYKSAEKDLTSGEGGIVPHSTLRIELVVYESIK